MNPCWITLPSLLVVATTSGAQQSRIVHGRVVSASDSTPIAGVAVHALDDRARPGVVTGPSGRFRLLVPPTTGRLLATRLGFAPETVTVANEPVVVRLTPAPLSLSPAIITADRATSSASSSVVRELDIQLRPRETSQELLRLAPGLVIAQHAGGGKASRDSAESPVP